MRRDRIDNVAESDTYEGPKPGTIRAPNRVQDRAAVTKPRVSLPKPATEADGTVVLDGSQDSNGGTRHHFVTDSTTRGELIAYLRSIDSTAFAFTDDPVTKTLLSAINSRR